MATTQALALEGHLPRATEALQRARRRRKVTPPWIRAWKRLWGDILVCERCERDARDLLTIGNERVCIRCVASARLPLAEPELAGATAVLRTLFKEAELEWRAQWGAPFLDRRRLDATLATAEVVLRWITPPTQRTHDMAALDARSALKVIAGFDRFWALRSTAARNLEGIYTCWRDRQALALRYFELEAVDRRYARIISAE